MENVCATFSTRVLAHRNRGIGTKPERTLLSGARLRLLTSSWARFRGAAGTVRPQSLQPCAIGGITLAVSSPRRGWLRTCSEETFIAIAGSATNAGPRHGADVAAILVRPIHELTVDTPRSAGIGDTYRGGMPAPRLL